jgi:hypothetical protein
MGGNRAITKNKHTNKQKCKSNAIDISFLFFLKKNILSLQHSKK